MNEHTGFHNKEHYSPGCFKCEQKDKCPDCDGNGFLADGNEGITINRATCSTCNGTGEKKLDNPDRDKIAKILLAYKKWVLNYDPVGGRCSLEDATDQIIAILPDTEATKKQTIRLTIDYLSMHYCLIATETIIKEIEKQALKGESNE